MALGGGVLGSAYPLCGISVVRNILFGRIAGANASALARGEERLSEPNSR